MRITEVDFAYQKQSVLKQDNEIIRIMDALSFLPIFILFITLLYLI